mgnify:CR=1 FL=1
MESPKDKYVFFNDEWNIKNDNPLDKQTDKERIEVLKKELINNDKPDGRRYKK